MTYAVGQDLPPKIHTVTREQVVRYAGASGDFNPIHYDDEVARNFGLPGVIAHGMLNMGMLAAYVIDSLGPDRVRMERFGVRFRAVVRPGDRLVMSGRVQAEELSEHGGRSLRLSLALTVEGQPHPAITGDAVVRMTG